MSTPKRFFRDPIIREIVKTLHQDHTIHPSRWNRYQRHFEYLDRLIAQDQRRQQARADKEAAANATTYQSEKPAAAAR